MRNFASLIRQMKHNPSASVSGLEFAPLSQFLLRWWPLFLFIGHNFNSGKLLIASSFSLSTTRVYFSVCRRLE